MSDMQITNVAEMIDRIFIVFLPFTILLQIFWDEVWEKVKKSFRNDRGLLGFR